MDLEEFNQLLSQHEKDVYTFCYHLAKTRDLADELYQETVLKSFERMHKIDVSNNPKAFLFTIAIGTWKNMSRKVKRREGIAPTLPLTEELAGYSSNNSVEKQVEQGIRDKLIRETVSEMEDGCRIPMLLMYFGGHSIAEISQICKIPDGTVKSRLRKGRGLVKAALEKEGFAIE